MLKRCIAFVIALCFISPAHAANQDLNSAFNELNYSLVVEWDQKDKEFYRQKLKSFVEQLTVLRANGLTDQEIQSFISSRSQQNLDSIWTVLKLNRMNSEEASEFVMEFTKTMYAKGASWNGNALAFAGVGLLIVAAVIVLSRGTTDSNTCSEQICDYTGNMYCYYDMWGERWCELEFDCIPNCP